MGPHVRVPPPLPLLLSPSPHSAMWRTLSGSPHTLLVCSIFCPNRVMADYGPPIAAARPLICPWAPKYQPPHAAARSTVSHGSLYGLPLLLSPSPHSAMCHFQVSSHCWCVSIFC
ncbi:unnamed protein product, partial [Staurois parvus]